MVIASHTIKRQPYGSCQLPITRLQNMIISYNKLYHIMSWPYHITTCPEKQVRRPLLCCCKFYVAAMGLARTVLTYASKTTMIFRQVWCLNLQQGPGIATLDSTKVGETDTRQPPLCISTSVEPVSWMQSCNVGLGRFIQQYRRIKVWHAGKQSDYYRPQLFVFHSCISFMHRPGSDATLGECSMQFQKNSYDYTRSI